MWKGPLVANLKWKSRGTKRPKPLFCLLHVPRVKCPRLMGDRKGRHFLSTPLAVNCGSFWKWSPCLSLVSMSSSTGRVAQMGWPVGGHSPETWWRQDVETLSAVLALCDRWIPPTKGPVVRTCDVFFVATWLSCQTNSWNVGDLRRHMFLGCSRWDSSYCCNASHTLCSGFVFCCIVLGTSVEQPRGLWVNYSHESASAFGTTTTKKRQISTGQASHCMGDAVYGLSPWDTVTSATTAASSSLARNPSYKECMNL